MLQVLNARALCAPNLWHSRPVMYVEVAAESVHTFDPLQLIRQLQGTTTTCLSDEAPHLPTAAHLLLHVALLLQRQRELAVEFGIVEPTEFPFVWLVVVETENAAIGQATLDTAVRLLERHHESPGATINDILDEYAAVVAKSSLGGRTRHLVLAAQQCGIPVIHLDNESLLQLGQGIHRQRLLTAITERTSLLAETISRDKHLCRQLLSSVGLPVVEGIIASDAETAVRFAEELGRPVVVKPRDADYGHGVSLNLSNAVQIRSAWRKARAYSHDVIVERYQAGEWHRLLVVNRRIVAAARRATPKVVGDGQRTVNQLIAVANADPCRRAGLVTSFEPLRVGAIELAVLYHQGFGLDSIPPTGVEVALRNDAYLANGAIQIDVTDSIHPETAEMIVEATTLIGLDVAGVDVVSNDLSQPPAGESLAILEVNAEPAFTMHLAPCNIPSRPVPSAILESLFPSGQTGRIPLVAVLGDESLALSIVRELQTVQPMTACVTDHAWQLGRRCYDRESPSLAENLRAVWLHPDCAAVVAVVSNLNIELEGLPFNRCDILVCGDPEATNARAASILRLLISTKPRIVVIRSNCSQQVSDLMAGESQLIVIEPGKPEATTGAVASSAMTVIRARGQFERQHERTVRTLDEVGLEENEFHAVAGRIVVNAFSADEFALTK